MRVAEKEHLGMISEDLAKPQAAVVARPSGQPEPRRGSRQPVAPTAEQLAEIKENFELVMTHENGDIETSSDERRVAAYMRGGVFLMDNIDLLNTHAVALRQRVRQRGHKMEHVFAVPSLFLQELYEKKNKDQAKREVRPEISLELAQRQVITLLNTAAKLGASDIVAQYHDNGGNSNAEISVRIDGVIQKIGAVPVLEARTMFHAAYNMADAADTQYKESEFQNARIARYQWPDLDKSIGAIRLQYNPLINQGRAMIARLLYQREEENNLDVDVLGYNEQQIVALKDLRRMPYGSIIFSGPTGSGKSTTLKQSITSFLREVEYKRLVVSIEDPPEYIIPGVLQLPVLDAVDEEDRERKFRDALNAILRSNPDHIMIGEIRDHVTGKIAMRAAQDGHVLWSTIHSNNALTIPLGLRERGVEDCYIFRSDILTGLIGQRLVRKLCPQCRLTKEDFLRRNNTFVREDLMEDVDRIFGDRTGIYFANETGCSHCQRRGSVGRTAVAEIILPDQKLLDLLRDDKSDEARDYWLKEMKGISILDHGIQKIANGEVDPRDIDSRVGSLKNYDLDRVEFVLKGCA